MELKKFVAAIKADDMDKAKELYPKVRMYYEKINQWTGYHKIEKSLYQDNKIDKKKKKRC